MPLLTFDQYLRDAASKGEFVNVLFEERLFALIGTLYKLTDALTLAGVPHEVVGRLAVLIHVENRDPAHTVLTRDADLMIRRADLLRVVEVAEENGFRFRHTAGLDMLLYGDTPSAQNSVHLVFSEENVKPGQVEPNPALAPERVEIHGAAVPVIPVADLVRMKLVAFRDKDKVHIRALDAAGLTTAPVEQSLSEELRERLKRTRETE